MMYFASCSEYHNLGIYKEGSVEEVAHLYNTTHTWNMGPKEIGIILPSSGYLIDEAPLVIGKTLDLDALKGYASELLNAPETVEAIQKLKVLIPDLDVVGVMQ